MRKSKRAMRRTNYPLPVVRRPVKVAIPKRAIRPAVRKRE